MPKKFEFPAARRRRGKKAFKANYFSRVSAIFFSLFSFFKRVANDALSWLISAVLVSLARFPCSCPLSTPLHQNYEHCFGIHIIWKNSEMMLILKCVNWCIAGSEDNIKGVFVIISPFQRRQCLGLQQDVKKYATTNRKLFIGCFFSYLAKINADENKYCKSQKKNGKQFREVISEKTTFPIMAFLYNLQK